MIIWQYIADILVMHRTQYCSLFNIKKKYYYPKFNAY